MPIESIQDTLFPVFILEERQHLWHNSKKNERAEEKEKMDISSHVVAPPSSTRTSSTSPLVKLPSKQASLSVIHKKYRSDRAARAQRILKRIVLTAESFEVWHEAPLNAQQRRTLALARGVIKDSFCQYNADWPHQQLQTEEISFSSISTQSPNDLFLERSAPHRSDEGPFQSPDSIDWLTRATEAIEAVLIENLTEAREEDENGKIEKKENCVERQREYTTILNTWSAVSPLPPSVVLPFCSGRISLQLPASLGERTIITTAFHSSRPNLLLVAYSRPSNKEQLIAASSTGADNSRTPHWQFLLSKPILLVYDLKRPSSADPLHLFYSENNMTALCAASTATAPHLFVAGTDNGSLLLFDAQENANQFRSFTWPTGRILALRSASFTTDGFLFSANPSFSHSSPIKALQMDDFSSPSAHFGSNEDKSTDLAILLASSRSSLSVSAIDEYGELSTWFVRESNGEDEGTRIGAKIKMSLSEVVSLKRACSFFFNQEHLFYSGKTVSRHRKGGGTCHPSLYRLRFKCSDETGADEVLQLAPLRAPAGRSETLFFASYLSGKVALFEETREEALLEWDAPLLCSPLVSLAVSDAHPCLVCTLDAQGRIVWRDCTNQDQTDKVIYSGQLQKKGPFTKLTLNSVKNGLDVPFLVVQNSEDAAKGIVEVFALSAQFAWSSGKARAEEWECVERFSTT